ncbi:MAG: GNAT family N-acetyltransferase [Planctomycetes bacterium]|nr:GNAT family N-acetyltransferase [Planctomycetota bacterium]
MPDLVIQPVRTRRERKTFLELPWALYRDDPNWMPPLRLNQKELVNYKKHPYYEQNEIQTFLALRDGRPVGRVAALTNKAHNERHHDNRGFFGFFESIDDQSVADGLLDAVRDWLADRNLRSIRGPTNPSLNYECGLLVDGFRAPPFFMMTYNPPFYAALLENWGFKKTQDLYAFWGHVDMIDGLDEKLAFIGAEAKKRFNVNIRPIDKKNFARDVRVFLDVYNRSLVGTWGFAPMSDAEIRHTAAGLRFLMVPELAFIAEVDGEPIGAVFALPDYNPRIKKIDGRLFPFGFLHLLRKRHEIERIRTISTNVVPEYQKWGLGLTLLQALLPKITDGNIKEIEFSWVLESNRLSRGALEKGGAKLTKTYRLYDFEPAA